MEPIFLTKLIKGFLTSLIIHISKKLVYYIDNFFTETMDPINNTIVTCGNCGMDFRLHVLHKIDELEKCPECRSQLHIPEEVLTAYERNENWKRSPGRRS
jgi:DNA-directed RNA polymerase subunit RPC12/RpoP